MTVWFKDPMELFKKSKVLKFWPSANQPGDERINSATRFIMYLSTVLYLVNRDPRIFILAAMVIGTMYVLYTSGYIKEAHPVNKPASDCQLPIESNPMANVLLSDYGDNPNRPPACYYPTVAGEVSSLLDDTIPFDSGRSRSPLPAQQQRAAARQFFSNPATMIPSDQTAFAEFCYGKKFRPMCRDTPGQCDPNYWGVQTEAFAGLVPSGTKRS